MILRSRIPHDSSTRRTWPKMNTTHAIINNGIAAATTKTGKYEYRSSTIPVLHAILIRDLAVERARIKESPDDHPHQSSRADYDESGAPGITNRQPRYQDGSHHRSNEGAAIEYSSSQPALTSGKRLRHQLEAARVIAALRCSQGDRKEQKASADCAAARTPLATDQALTMMVNPWRGPARSISIPFGIWNSAIPSRNEKTITPY